LRAGRLGEEESVGGAALLTCPAANTVTASLSVPPYFRTFSTVFPLFAS
jgi:hypothetical protein